MITPTVKGAEVIFVEIRKSNFERYSSPVDFLRPMPGGNYISAMTVQNLEKLCHHVVYPITEDDKRYNDIDKLAFVYKGLVMNNTLLTPLPVIIFAEIEMIKRFKRVFDVDHPRFVRCDLWLINKVPTLKSYIHFSPSDNIIDRFELFVA